MLSSKFFFLLNLITLACFAGLVFLQVVEGQSYFMGLGDFFKF